MTKLSLLKVVKATQPEIIKMFVDVAQQKHLEYVVEKDNNYVYLKGNIPVTLVAHMDTVHLSPPTTVVYDPKEKIIWSPDGIGGDDRCGIFALLTILYSTRNSPSIVILDKEEKGCLGATCFAKDFPDKPEGMKYLIEIDRRGHNDCVFYGCGNEEFQKYVESFGFKKENGSSSDITRIMPAWDIAGTNLSAGYLREHTKEEHIRFNWLLETITKVKCMLAQNFDVVPDYEYKPYVYPSYVYPAYNGYNYEGRGSYTPYVGGQGVQGSVYGGYWEQDDEERWGYHKADEKGTATLAPVLASDPVIVVSKYEDPNLEQVSAKKLEFTDKVFLYPLDNTRGNVPFIDNLNGDLYLDSTGAVVRLDPKTKVGIWLNSRFVSRVIKYENPKESRSVFVTYNMLESEIETIVVDYTK